MVLNDVIVLVWCYSVIIIIRIVLVIILVLVLVLVIWYSVNISFYYYCINFINVKKKKNIELIDVNCNWYCCIYCYFLRIFFYFCLGMYNNLLVVLILILILVFNWCVRIRNSLEMCLFRNLLVFILKIIILDWEICFSVIYGYCNF